MARSTACADIACGIRIDHRQHVADVCLQQVLDHVGGQGHVRCGPEEALRAYA